MSSYLYYQD